MKILSIQDLSCYGQCSLSVALPVLSSRGIETAFLPSAILSTHTSGFEGFEVFDFTEPLKKIIAHWKRVNLSFDAIYTGYIAKADQFEMILECKKDFLKPGGLFFVDPAMADHGKLYPGLGQDIVEGMKTLCKAADIILPNITEACFLTGTEFKVDLTRDEVEAIAKKLAQEGPNIVIITGLSFEPGKLGTLAYDQSKDEFISYFVDARPNYHGTGDLFSSLMVAGILQDLGLKQSLVEASEFIVKSIEETLPDETHNYGVKFERILDQERKPV